MRFFLLGLLAVFLNVAALAQDGSDVHSKIRSYIGQRNYLAAINELELLRAGEPIIFSANNYDYLLGRICERAGDIGCAGRMYHSVVSRSSVLREYAMWHLARLARASGNLTMERLQLMELATFSPNIVLGEAARNRIARSWFESKNYDLAIAALLRPGRGPAPSQPAASNSRENKLLLARARLYNGETELARGIFTELITTLSNPAQPDDFALEAAKGLDLLEVGADKFGRVAPSLSDYEHLRRAQIYQFNRDFADARLHFTAIINNHPASGLVPDAIYQIGRGYAQTTNFTDAVKWYERVEEQFPEHPVSKEALLQLASSYARISKIKESIARYQKYIQRYPDDERVDRAYLNIIDVLRDSGEETEALQWAAKVQEVFRGKVVEAQALFAQARIHLSRNDWQSSLADLEKLRSFKELGGANLPGGTTTAEITFLRGFALENLRRYPEAIDAYLSIPDGRNEYYGWRATERLRLMTNDPAANDSIYGKLAAISSQPQTKEADANRRNLQSALRLTTGEAERAKLIEDLRGAYRLLPAYRDLPQFKLLDVGRHEIRKSEAGQATRYDPQAVADELLFLGLPDEAAPELDIAKRKQNIKSPAQPGSSDLDFTIAHYYLKGDRADRAAAFIEPLLKSLPADFQPELIPDQIAVMLYPTPYVDSLLKYAAPTEVDPRFMLAIMRQESRFRPGVKSNAAARGLMQFISTTSEKIAAELGRENFDQDALYDPPTAVLFGSQYIGNLFKLFPKQPDAVAASYNGGEDNMKRWLGRSKSNVPDRYVPEIAFSQSKDYVYRVMTNFRVYQMLYDENLKRR